MKNGLQDLTDHLFAQLERLSDETSDPEQIRTEIGRAGAITTVAREIIATGRLAVDAQRIAHEFGGPQTKPPTLLRLDKLNGQK